MAQTLAPIPTTAPNTTTSSTTTTPAPSVMPTTDFGNDNTNASSISSTTPLSPHSETNTGVIVGATVAAVVVVIVLIVVFIFIRKRRKETPPKPLPKLNVFGLPQDSVSDPDAQVTFNNNSNSSSHATSCHHATADPPPSPDIYVDPDNPDATLCPPGVVDTRARAAPSGSNSHSNSHSNSGDTRVVYTNLPSVDGSSSGGTYVVAGSGSPEPGGPPAVVVDPRLSVTPIVGRMSDSLYIPMDSCLAVREAGDGREEGEGEAVYTAPDQQAMSPPVSPLPPPPPVACSPAKQRYVNVPSGGRGDSNPNPPSPLQRQVSAEEYYQNFYPLQDEAPEYGNVDVAGGSPPSSDVDGLSTSPAARSGRLNSLPPLPSPKGLKGQAPAPASQSVKVFPTSRAAGDARSGSPSPKPGVTHKANGPSSAGSAKSASKPTPSPKPSPKPTPSPRGGPHPVSPLPTGAPPHPSPLTGPQSPPPPGLLRTVSSTDSEGEENYENVMGDDANYVNAPNRKVDPKSGQRS